MSNLSWSSHIAQIHSKSKRLIGMLYRRFYKHAKSNTLLMLYASLIRPHLEYCSVVWDPYLNKDINLLEKTQKFGLRLCLKDWLSDYNDLLNRANLPSLETRRTRTRLGYIYKIFNELMDYPNAPIKLQAYSYNSQSNNSKPLIPLQSRTTQCQNSFFYRTIPQWNSLPMEVVSLTSISSFKHSLIDII